MSDYPSLPILTAAQMRQCDAYAIQTDPTIPSRVLMERAARAVARCIDERFPASAPLTVLCGGGNNGGDGFALARFAALGDGCTKRPVSVLYLGRLTEAGLPDTLRMSEECARQYALYAALGDSQIKTVQGDTDVTDWGNALPQGTVLADAVFGIGLDRAVAGTVASVFRFVNQSGLPVVAVDIPSGIHADSGRVLGDAMRCTATVTMQALKPGLLLYPGADLCGDITVANIGIHTAGQRSPLPDGTKMHLIGESDLRFLLPPRQRRTHKGTYGNVLLAVGSVGMAGAAVLSASAALRTGAGLVTVMTPEENRIVLQTSAPEAVLIPYNSQDPADTFVGHRLFKADGSPAFSSLVCGCGLGTGQAGLDILTFLLKKLSAYPSTPVVLDADALNLIAAHPTLWQTGLLDRADKQVIITPHPTEMSRLCGQSVSEILSALPQVALDYAAAHGVTVVLKDAHTVIVSPDGQLYVSVAGHAGMAKGGSGDVLAGILGGISAQNAAPLRAGYPLARTAAVGVLLHGMAGDYAAMTYGEYGMTASDIVSALPAVTRAFSDSRTVIKQDGLNDQLERGQL